MERVFLMDGTLIFCSDSVLRFRSDFDEMTAYPMTMLQEVIENGEKDPYFLLRYFHHNVAIEEGTTLANIFFAIEPWKDLLTAYLGRNVGAYIDETRKPSSISSWDIEWIGIYRSTSVHRAYEHTPMKDVEDLMAYFNRKRIPTKEFNIEHGCDASGFVNGQNERYSISGDIHEVKNIPVVLIGKQTLAAHLGKNKSLFKKSILGVESEEYANFIVGETSFCFSEMMKAIFVSGLFFDTPQYAKQTHEEVKEISKALHESLERDGKDVIEEAAEIEKQGKADGDEDKPMKVVVADGAFDSVINHMDYESEYWKLLKKKTKGVDGAPIRIGEIAEATPPEVRLYGKLIE